MENNKTAVEYIMNQLRQLAHNPNTHLGLGDVRITQGLIDELADQAKEMERENASTFGIRVTSECCILKNGKIEVDLHKFEKLLTEMYGE